jgi:pSer/pThr/pTyr-binding forkhead associated (FHA) protein
MTDSQNPSEEAGPATEAAPAALLPLELIIVDHYGRQSRCLLQYLPVTFGRDEAADVRLGDPWVSHAHCQVLEIAGVLVVRDLDSKNGVFLHSVRVLEAELSSGDCLTLGRTEVTFVYQQPPKPDEGTASNLAATLPGSPSPAAQRPVARGPHTEQLLY